MVLAILPPDDQQPHIVTEESGVADSGANISLMNSSTAISLGGSIVDLEKPIVVQFGKAEAKSTIKRRAFFEKGAYLESAYINDDITKALVAVTDLVDISRFVVFTSESVYIVDNESSSVLLAAPKGKSTRLYEFSLSDLTSVSTEEKPFKKFVAAGEAIDMSDDDADDDEILDEAEIRKRKFNTAIPQGRKGAKGVRFSAEHVRIVRHLHCNGFHHMPYSTIADGLRDPVKYDGVPEWLTPALVEAVARKNPCLACRLARQRNLHRSGSGVSPVEIGAFLSVDFEGPFTPTTAYGCNGYFLFVCLATGYLIVILTTSKDALSKATEKVVKFFQQHGHTVRNIRTDYGSYERSQEFDDCAARFNFTISSAEPSAQERNPVERHVQFVKDDVVANFIAQNTLTACQWGSNVSAIVEAANRTTNSKTKNFGRGEKTPVELVTRSRPNILDFMTLATGDLVTFPRTTPRTHLQPRNEAGIFAYRDYKNNDMVILPGSKIPVPRKGVKKVEVDEVDPNSEELSEVLPSANIDGTTVVKSRAPDVSIVPRQPIERRVTRSMTSADDSTQVQDDDENVPVDSIAYWASAETDVDESFAFAAHRAHDLDNPTATMIKKDPALYEEWKPHIASELEQLTPPEVMQEASEREYAGKVILRFLILFKKKYHPSGAFDKYKVRMPLDGSKEVFDNAQDNYSPSLQSGTLMFLLAIAAFFGWMLSGSDVTGAFIETPLEREVYATFPKWIMNGVYIVYR